MTTIPDLLPCPFCGCTTVENKDDGHEEWFECGWCHATSGYDPAPEFEGDPASFHWNRRADRVARDDGLREALEVYAHHATKTITGLAGGGSELFGKPIGDTKIADLPVCAERIRYRIERGQRLAAYLLKRSLS